MYSQCPDCQTRFRVTADALRAARGTVRCGRCGSAFDALERLTDFIPPPEHEARSARLLVAPDSATDIETGPETAPGVEFHFSAADLERVFVDASDWRESRAQQSLDSELADGRLGTQPESQLVVLEGSSVEDITLEGEQVSVLPPSYPPVDEPSPEPQAETDARPAAAPAPEHVPAAEAAGPRRTVAEELAPLAARRWRRPPEIEEQEPAAGSSPWRTAGLTLASLVLAVALAAQLAHYFRQDLVRHPQLGPPLRTIYERLGLELMPNWDLGAFELRQWGNQPDAATSGRLVVRASLTNRATFAQPHPLLRLELEDRFGNTVATRDFEPAEYLKNPSQATRLMAPGASSEAELLLADTGRDAVGYRLDVCLRESATLLRCAAGPG